MPYFSEYSVQYCTVTYTTKIIRAQGEVKAVVDSMPEIYKVADLVAEANFFDIDGSPTSISRAQILDEDIGHGSEHVLLSHGFDR